MNKTIDIINNRTSLRKFSDQKVSEAHKKVIISSALRAPTAGNLMLYSILKVENKETLKTLSSTCDEQPFIASADFALIFLADYQRLYDYFSFNNYFSYCQEQGVVPEFPSLSDLLLCSEDAICAAQNSVIAAESLDIGSCYIGDIIENYEIHKELFHLEKLTFPIGMLVFGHYPDNIHRKPRSRFDSNYIVFDEKYKRFSSDELHCMFEEYERNFNHTNTKQAKNYAQMLYSKKFGSEYAKEMRRSSKVAYEEWLSYGFESLIQFNKKK